MGQPEEVPVYVVEVKRYLMSSIIRVFDDLDEARDFLDYCQNQAHFVISSVWSLNEPIERGATCRSRLT